jgi:hypothetical protein
MPDEKDLSKIFITDETKEYDIEFKGEKFHFKVREIPWVTLNKIASKAMDYNAKKVTIDRSEYDILFLEAALVEAPWPLDKTRMVIKRINKEFGNALRKIVIPDPFLAEDEELKNE